MTGQNNEPPPPPPPLHPAPGQGGAEGGEPLAPEGPIQVGGVVFPNLGPDTHPDVAAAIRHYLLTNEVSEALRQVRNSAPDQADSQQRGNDPQGPPATFPSHLSGLDLAKAQQAQAQHDALRETAKYMHNQDFANLSPRTQQVGRSGPWARHTPPQPPAGSRAAAPGAYGMNPQNPYSGFSTWYPAAGITYQPPVGLAPPPSYPIQSRSTYDFFDREMSRTTTRISHMSVDPSPSPQIPVQTDLLQEELVRLQRTNEELRRQIQQPGPSNTTQLDQSQRPMETDTPQEIEHRNKDEERFNRALHNCFKATSPFDPEEQDFEDWLETTISRWDTCGLHIDRYKTDRSKDERLKRLLYNCLTLPVSGKQIRNQTYLIGLNPGKEVASDSFPIYYDRLVTKFSTPDREVQAEAEFKIRRQARDEAPAAYAAAKLQLWYKAYPGDERCHIKGFLDSAIAGILNLEVRRELYRYNTIPFTAWVSTVQNASMMIWRLFHNKVGPEGVSSTGLTVGRNETLTIRQQIVAAVNDAGAITMEEDRDAGLVGVRESVDLEEEVNALSNHKSRGRCYDCGSYEHFQNSSKCTEKGARKFAPNNSFKKLTFQGDNKSTNQLSNNKERRFRSFPSSKPPYKPKPGGNKFGNKKKVRYVQIVEEEEDSEGENDSAEEEDEEADTVANVYEDEDASCYGWGVEDENLLAHTVFGIVPHQCPNYPPGIGEKDSSPLPPLPPPPPPPPPPQANFLTTDLYDLNTSTPFTTPPPPYVSECSLKKQPLTEPQSNLQFHKEMNPKRDGVVPTSPEREKTPRSDVDSEAILQMPPSKVCKVSLCKQDTDLAYASQETQNQVDPDESDKNSADTFFDTVNQFIENRDIKGLRAYRKERRAQVAAAGLPVNKCYPEARPKSPPLLTADELLADQEFEAILEVAPTETEASDTGDEVDQSAASETDDGPARLAAVLAYRMGETSEEPLPSPVEDEAERPGRRGPGAHRHTHMRGRARAPPTSLFRRMKKTRKTSDQNPDTRCGHCRPCPPCPPCYLIKPDDKVPEDLAIPLSTAPPVGPLMGRTKQALRCLFVGKAREAWSEEAFDNEVDLDRSIAAYLTTLADIMEQDVAREEKHFQDQDKDQDTSSQSLVDYASSDDEENVNPGFPGENLDVQLDEPPEEMLEGVLRNLDGVLVTDDPVALFSGTTKILEDTISSANYTSLPRETLLACHLRLKHHYLEYLRKVAHEHSTEVTELKNAHQKEREDDKRKLKNANRNLASSRNVRKVLNERALSLQDEVNLLKKQVVLNEHEVVTCQQTIKRREETIKQQGEQLVRAANLRAQSNTQLKIKSQAFADVKTNHHDLQDKLNVKKAEVQEKVQALNALRLRVKNMELHHQANIQDSRNQLLDMHSSRVKELDKNRKDVLKKLDGSEKKLKASQAMCDRLTKDQRDLLQQREQLIRERDDLSNRLRAEEAHRNRTMLAGCGQPDTPFYNVYTRTLRMQLAEFQIYVDGSQDGQMANLPALCLDFSYFWRTKASRLSMPALPAQGRPGWIRPPLPASGGVRSVPGLLPVRNPPVSLPTCPLPMAQCAPLPQRTTQMDRDPEDPVVVTHVLQPPQEFPVISIPELPDTVELDDIECVAGPDVVGHIQLAHVSQPKPEEVKMEEEVEYVEEEPKAECVEDQPMSLEDSPPMVAVEEQIDIVSFKTEDLEQDEAEPGSEMPSESSPFQGGAGQPPAAPTRP